MEINDKLEQYYSKDLIKINILLNKIDNLKYEVEHGDTHFLCDISGVCEVEKVDDDADCDIGSCFFCGTELRRVNDDWYHNTAFDDNYHLIDSSYQTHNYMGSKAGQPRSVEERNLEDVEDELNKYNKLKIKQFALFGNPVSHSESPRIYNRLFVEKESLSSYVAKEVNGIRDIANQINNFDAVNITYPFKEVATNIVDDLTYYAEVTSSVNLIKKDGRKLIGYNTDGIGFSNTIDKLNQRILIIGAGSTAKVSAIVLKENGHSVYIVNRSQKNLEFFKEYGIHTFLSKNMPIEKFDIIVNMTNAGLEDNELPLEKEKLIELIKLSSKGIDLIYNKKTPFLALFEEYGKEYEDGKRMLLSQAIENMKIFFK